MEAEQGPGGGARVGSPDPASLNFLLGLKRETGELGSGLHSVLTSCVTLVVLSSL